MNKRLLLLLSFVSLSLLTFGQMNCTVPVSTTFFQREYGTISSTSNSTTKLNYAINMVTTNCVSSSQVKQITMLFFADQDKFEFAKDQGVLVASPEPGGHQVLSRSLRRFL